MSLKSALSELFSPAPAADKPDQVNAPAWTGIPVGVLVLFAAGLIWLGKGVLTHENLQLVFWLALATLGCHTAVHLVQIIVNGAILRERQKYLLKDGTASAEDVAALSATPTEPPVKP
jgi:hypothetical protein